MQIGLLVDRCDPQPFHLKRPDEHWSDRPAIEALDETEAPADAGDPPPGADRGRTLTAVL